MLEKITDFIKEHILLVIGGILYLAVFIISFKISPWDDFSIEELDSNIKFNNSNLQHLPILKFLCFGISELGQGFKYANGLGLNNSVGFSYFIAVCAVFTYINLIKLFCVNEDNAFGVDISFQSPVEKFLIRFCFDNVFMYIATILVAYFYFPASAKIFGFWHSSNWLLKIVLAILILAIIIVPSIPNFIYIFAYDFVLVKIIQLVNFMDYKMHCFEFIKVLAMFLTVVILILAMNIIMEKLLELIQILSMKCSAGIMASSVGIALGIVFTIIKAIVGILILCGIIMLISKIL